LPVLEEVSRVAAEAGRIAHSRSGSAFSRWEKVPGHPVCDVDLEVDAFLREHLTALDPEAGWLSEETLDASDRIERPRLWVVDPIDGTRDYLRGRPGWAVSIALVEDRVPVIGVLDAPARGEHWAAARGQGARRNGVLLCASGRSELAGARVPTDQLPAADADLVAVPKPNSIALRIALVAAGEADLVVTLMGLRMGYRGGRADRFGGGRDRQRGARSAARLQYCVGGSVRGIGIDSGHPSGRRRTAARTGARSGLKRRRAGHPGKWG